MQKISCIGLGKMGSAIATRLLQAGFQLTVYNRTRNKMLDLEKHGAILANSLEESVTGADIIFTSVFDDKAILSVTETILPHIKSNAININTSTILPKTATILNQMYKEKNCVYIAAPILGVPSVVLSGTATVIYGGDQAILGVVKPLLDSFASNIIINPGDNPAHANVLKICLNYTIVTAIELISELYAFAEKSGLETNAVQKSLHYVYSHPAIVRYIDKIYNRDFDQVNFDMKGGNKDISMFQEAFNDVGVSPDIANIIRGKFTQALATELAEKDWSAISEVVRNRSGLE